MSNVIEGTSRFGFLEIRSERSDDEHVIALTGELDLDGAERVTQELHARRGDGRAPDRAGPQPASSSSTRTASA